jgi:hypothetical protein
VRDFEIWNNAANRDPLTKMAARFGFEPSAVPTIFIGDRYWVGFAEQPIGKEIEAYVASCALSGCPDAGAGIFVAAPTSSTGPTPPTVIPPTVGASATPAVPGAPVVLPGGAAP